MARKLRFHKAIPDDLVNALEFHEEVSPRLANRFRENVDRRFDEIAKHPKMFPVDIPNRAIYFFRPCHVNENQFYALVGLVFHHLLQHLRDDLDLVIVQLHSLRKLHQLLSQFTRSRH